jgi:hypothetical protein
MVLCPLYTSHCEAWCCGHRLRLMNRRSRVRIPPGCKVLGIHAVFPVCIFIDRFKQKSKANLVCPPPKNTLKEESLLLTFNLSWNRFLTPHNVWYYSFFNGLHTPSQRQEVSPFEVNADFYGRFRPEAMPLIEKLGKTSYWARYANARIIHFWGGWTIEILELEQVCLHMWRIFFLRGNTL